MEYAKVDRRYNYLITKETRKSGEEIIGNIYENKIRRHTLLNDAENFSCAKEDENLFSFNDFLKCKNFYEINELKGNFYNE